MKTSKISKILGVGLALAMLTSLLTVATPASAGTLEFTTESLPSGITYVTNGVGAGVSLTDYAVAGDKTTIYAVAGTNHLYKSTNSGASWSRRTLTVSGALLPGMDVVAVAPDNPDVVAVADSVLGVGTLTLTVPGVGGWNYTPVVTFTPTSATMAVVFAPTTVASFVVTNAGSGYLAAPTVTITGGAFDANGATISSTTAATATVALAGTGIGAFTLVSAGTGFTAVPTVTISAPPTGGVQATAVALLTATSVASLILTGAGNYPLGVAPTIAFAAGTPAGATANAATAATSALAALPTMFISTNGAATGETDSFNNAGAIGATVLRDIAISPAVSGVREVVAAGNTAAGPGVFALNLGGTLATWTDITTVFTDSSGATLGVLGATATTSVHAVAFSPNYVSDRVLTAISNDTAAGTSFLNLGRFLTATTGQWNVAAGFTDYTGAAGGGLINGTSGTLTSASISLAPTYTGLDGSSRIAFVTLDTGAVVATNGVLRMTDAVSKLISDGATRFRSVAYNGSRLVAGAAASNNVFNSADPLASSPTLTAASQPQRPSGGLGGVGATTTTTLVAWAGANVVASTLGDESAFSSSADNGATFNDISQIRTAITNILDIAVAADGSKLYMVSNDSNTAATADTSVWSRTGTTWVRLMSIVDAGTGGASNAFSLRIPPTAAASNVVYLINNGTPNFYYSNDSGDKNWTTRIANEAITDLSVESADVIYYASGLNMRKSVNAGFLWSDPATAVLTTGAAFSISSLGVNKLIVTSNDGVVAYSDNGTVTRLGPLTGGGNIQATANTLATGDFVYAAGDGFTVAADNVIYRYKIGSVTPDNVWEKIINVPPMVSTTTMDFTGIALKSGVLYATAIDAGGSHLWRSLNPTAARTSVVFDDIGLVLLTPDFTIAGGRTSNLQFSSSTAGNIIWAIDDDNVVSEDAGDSAITTNDEVYSFTDTIALATAAPTQTSPAASAVIPVNPVSGITFNIAFSWNRPSLATAYELQIAYDSAFNQQISLALTPAANPIVPVDPAVSPVSVTVGGATFNPGTTYYWRVRAIAPTDSAWSATRTFSVGSLDAPFALKQPAIGAVDVSTKPVLSWSAYTGAKWYEVTVSEDPTFAIPEWSHNVGAGIVPPTTVYGVVDALKFSTTYYWRVRGVTADPFVQGTAVITPAGPYQYGAFTTMADPATTATTPPQQVIITQQAPPQPPTIITLPPTVVEKPAAIPNWMLLTIIVIGAVLVVALIVLIVRTRRVA